MDSNPRLDLNESNNPDFTNNKFLIVKIPANVLNAKKACEFLGGKEKILSKFAKDEDLELANVFSKKIPLEKCLSNDFVLKRKRMKNLTTGEKKYKFEIKGRVDSMYEYFALHDFLCFKGDKDKTDLKNLEKFVISPEDVYNIINCEGDKIKMIVDKKVTEENLDEIPNEYSQLQPEKFSFNRNNYVNVINQLKNLIKLSK